MSIDLDNIPITFNCSREQLKAQVSYAVTFLLRNTKPADLVRGSSGRQRVSERGSEGSGGAKGKGVSALRDLSDSSIAVLPGNVNRSISNADPDDFQQIRP